jgi:hypothetical protein
VEVCEDGASVCDGNIVEVEAVVNEKLKVDEEIGSPGRV